MENNFFAKLFDQVIEEAAPLCLEKEEKDVKNIEEIKFSDVHNEKMKNLFKSVRKDENRKIAVKVTKKVAIIVLCTMLITCGLVSTVEAWRREVVKFFMKNNEDNYMSINFSDPCDLHSGDFVVESGELEADTVESKITNTYLTDDIHFLYLPEGFEVELDRERDSTRYCSFRNGENYLYLAKELLKNFSKQSDIEETYNEKIIFGDKEVFYVIKDNRVNYVWYDEVNLYSVASSIEENETLKFIENIKILKNF